MNKISTTYIMAVLLVELIDCNENHFFTDLINNLIFLVIWL